MAGSDWPSYDDYCQGRVRPYILEEIKSKINPSSVEHPTFCVLPFYGWEYPANVACCLLDRTYDLDSVKQDMLANRRSPACAKCWRIEDAGQRSDRQVKNQILDAHLDRDLDKLIEDCAQGRNYRAHYKIDTSNTCNSTCVTCSSQWSSSWAQLERRHGINARQMWKKTPEDVDAHIDYAHAVNMSFRGGEPLLSDTNFHILEQLLKTGNNRCLISFTTNGSIKVSAAQHNILRQFNSVNFCFSIDGVGPVFEYLRYPLRWKDIEHNIAWCKENNILVSASYTVSSLNIDSDSETRAWFDANSIPYQINNVYTPAWYSPTAWQEPRLVDLMRTDLARQDQMKGIQLQDYLPKIAQRLG